MWDRIKQVSEQAHRILRRKLSYQECLTDGAGNLTIASGYMMKDLAKFCNANRSSVQASMITGSIDPLSVAFNEGKRAVFNRLVKYCSMTDDQIVKMYKEIEGE